MRLYLDDCADSDKLGELLRTVGHEVFTPRTESLLGVNDSVHLAHSARHRLVLLTKNPTDFVALHAEYQAAGRPHSGIPVIYGHRIRSKDMTLSEIVEAIGNLEGSGIPIENEVHNLNHWR